jgi:hypothetical protein
MGNRIRGTFALLGAGALALSVLAGTSASASVKPAPASAQTTTAASADPTLHPTKVTNKSSGAKVMGSRKATQAEVNAGFAASTAATIYLCNDGITIRNPMTDQFDRDFAAYIGWEESTSSGGYPMARINQGNSLFVKNNDTHDIFWSDATWSNNYGGYAGTQYAWTHWKHHSPLYNSMVSYGGGQLGINVLSTGTSNPNNPADVWEWVSGAGSGFRNFISNQAVGPAFNTPGNQPILGITTWGNGSYDNYNTNTLVGIEATNSSPCGYLVD